MIPTPRFIQGVFPFDGNGLDSPYELDGARYVVPATKRAQLVYMRGGNSANELVYLVLTRGGRPMRLFPIGAKASLHVPLALVEDISAETLLAVLVAAPKGTSGTVVVDFGIFEVD